MPERTKPIIAAVQNRYSEKVLRVPSDLMMIFAGLAAIANLGVVVLGVVVIAAIIGAVVFSV